jgi:hypothetical protein
VEELVLIKVFLNKQEYLKYYKYTSSINTEPEIKVIFDLISKYYDEYPEAEQISLDELKTYFFMQYPLYKDRDSYTVIFNNLISLEVNNPDLVIRSLKNLIERYYASEIIESLTSVLSGTEYGVLQHIDKKLDEFHNTVLDTEEQQSPFVESSLAELLTEEVLSDGLRWRLKCLNDDIGDLRGGNLGHVYARPDTGKTSFFSDQITYFASQLVGDQIIAWFNNEERGTKVKLRLYSSMLNKTKEEIAADPQAAEQEFIEKGGDKIKIYDSAIINMYDIENILREYNVRVLVIDQGDKVKFRGDKELAGHERLKILYGMFRELAKEYCCDIITAGQASANAEGLQYLQLDMMDNSKTGKPGELDYAIAIGFSPEEGRETLRYIHVAKNKMKNGVHGKYIVRFDALRARYYMLDDSPTEGVMNGYQEKAVVLADCQQSSWSAISSGPGTSQVSVHEAANRGVY